MWSDTAEVCPRIVLTVEQLFVPGWAANARIYRPGVPEDWEILPPPSFEASGGTIEAYRRWLVEVCGSRPGPVVLAGHSFGAALAVLAALDPSVQAERLVLVNPSVLPLEKPVPLMLWDFGRRVAARWFPPGTARPAVGQVLRHPLLARRVGTEVRNLDLSPELGRLRGIPCKVVATSTDTLTPPAMCRRVAELCAADYRELDVPGGHLWFLRAPGLLARELSA
jgi:pimeloyl-ACP methyl ester carboxylesterase